MEQARQQYGVVLHGRQGGRRRPPPPPGRPCRRRRRGCSTSARGARRWSGGGLPRCRMPTIRLIETVPPSVRDWCKHRIYDLIQVVAATRTPTVQDVDEAWRTIRSRLTRALEPRRDSRDLTRLRARCQRSLAASTDARRTTSSTPRSPRHSTVTPPQRGSVTTMSQKNPVSAHLSPDATCSAFSARPPTVDAAAGPRPGDEERRHAQGGHLRRSRHAAPVDHQRDAAVLDVLADHLRVHPLARREDGPDAQPGREVGSGGLRHQAHPEEGRDLPQRQALRRRVGQVRRSSRSRRRRPSPSGSR